MIRRWSPFLFLLQLLTQLVDRQTDRERKALRNISRRIPHKRSILEGASSSPQHSYLSYLLLQSAAFSLLRRLPAKERDSPKETKQKFILSGYFDSFFCTCSFRDTQMCRKYAEKWSFGSM